MLLEGYKIFIEWLNLQNIHKDINKKFFRNNIDTDEIGVLIYAADTGSNDSITHFEFTAQVFIFDSNYNNICDIADTLYEYCKKHFEINYKDWIIGQFYPLSNPSLPFKEIGEKNWQILFDIRIFLQKINREV
jgi:hypothetical protein